MVFFRSVFSVNKTYWRDVRKGGLDEEHPVYLATVITVQLHFTVYQHPITGFFSVTECHSQSGFSFFQHLHSYQGQLWLGKIWLLNIPAGSR